MTELFLKGFCIGLAIAAPIGPINLLCIQRTLRDGFKVGLMTAFGAALADGVYGLSAGFGLTAVTTFLVSQQFWIRLIGGLFLLYLGGKTWLTPASHASQLNKKPRSIADTVSSTFLLTLTNPTTILSFIAVFAGLGLGSCTNYYQAVTLVTGIFIGSASWGLLLSGVVKFFLHRRISPKIMRWINRTSASILVLFGTVALMHL